MNMKTICNSCLILVINDVLLCPLFVGQLVPLAYGVKKLQIACVIEDDKVKYA